MAKRENRNKIKKVGGNLGFLLSHRTHMGQGSYAKHNRIQEKLDRELELMKKLFLTALILGIISFLTKVEIPTEILRPVLSQTTGLTGLPKYCEGEINSLFCNVHYKWDAKTMLATCMIENGYQTRGDWDSNMTFTGNPDGSIDRGICSINSVHGYSEEELYNPRKNVEIAYEIWKSQGNNAWYVFRDNRHLIAMEFINEK